MNDQAHASKKQSKQVDRHQITQATTDEISPLLSAQTPSATDFESYRHRVLQTQSVLDTKTVSGGWPPSGVAAICRIPALRLQPRAFACRPPLTGRAGAEADHGQARAARRRQLASPANNASCVR
eukprot:388828-Pelagomonas_calceolata.AAC.2